jgi:hypothetical protein
MEYEVAKDRTARGVSYPSKTELKIAKRKQLGLIRAPVGSNPPVPPRTKPIKPIKPASILSLAC